MDRGQRRANERTSRQDFGVLKARKQSRVVKRLFYPFRLVLLAIDGELFDVHENGVPPSNCSNDFKSDHAFRQSTEHQIENPMGSVQARLRNRICRINRDEQLRQTTFLGWRDDRNPKEVVLE